MLWWLSALDNIRPLLSSGMFNVGVSDSALCSVDLLYVKIDVGIMQCATVLIHLFESCSLAEEEIKAEQEVVEGMDISTRSKGE